MKVIIPVAGIGSRLKPHTFSTAKPLMEVAGKSILGYILDEVIKLNPEEINFVVGYKKENIKYYVTKYLKNNFFSFVEQKNRNGDGGAIKLSLDYFKKNYEDDDVLIIFGDTLIDFDLKKEFAKFKDYDGIVFTKKVNEPQHYGVVYEKEGLIYDVVEKPEKPKSDLAIIGAYWFKSFYDLSEKIDTLFKEKITSKGEYKLADAIKLMVNDHLKSYKLCSVKVQEWFDCGRPEVLLEANKYLLEKKGNGGVKVKGNSLIISPAYVSKSSDIKKSIIGKNASIATGAVVENSIIENSIVGKNAVIKNVVLKNSIVGSEVSIRGNIKKLNIGEKSVLIFE